MFRSHLAAVDEADFGLVLRAARFAAWKHRDQRRKGRGHLPYINHPLDLADVLWFEGGVRDPAVLAAALLHDTIEDTQTSLQELQGEFGERVARIVMEVTDERSLHWRARKKLQVSRARLASTAARQVKLADKICNLRSMISAPPNGWSIDRQRAYFDWAKDVVDQLRGANPELEARFDQVHKKRP
ncbi:MAG: HD domain-containing protein [Gammaproteobacteria bacterium]|nr:HD domain-containing protein [Gammaproteobacteria bacterium]MBM4223831.1 HD domain-containing protein [Gammaproteobacteria bacterium]MBM4230780.1 HD domain-containing protein [Gammaproteobacteria bacterium]